MTLCQRCVSDLGRWGAWGRHARCCSPADAGAQLNHDHRPRPWTPAFAGERVWLGTAVVWERGGERLPPPKKATTPAKAGAQLGDGGNGRRRFVTPAFPTGPRPSPGWRRIVLGERRALPTPARRPRRSRALWAGSVVPAALALSCARDPPARSSRSTASCRAARCRSSRSDAPAPACAPPSARADQRGCRG